MSKTEELLTAIWRDVVGRDPDPSDDFFAVGGDSIRAAALTAKVKRQINKSVRTRMIFNHRTFAEYLSQVETVSNTTD